MQVNDKVVMFIFQLGNNLADLVVNANALTDVRVSLQNRQIFFLAQVIDLSFRELLPKAADKWCGQHNIAN